MRICVNQDGQRVYDAFNIPEGKEINLLTVIPNETYETFVSQYQNEIVEVYGSTEAGAETRNIHKGEKRTEREIRRNDELFQSKSFKEFWKRLSLKTDYIVAFDEKQIIEKSIEALNQIEIPEHLTEISLGRISEISEEGIKTGDFRKEVSPHKIKFYATPIDLVEELSENTALAYPTVFQIIKGLKNHRQIIKNPARFLQEATAKIREIELGEMLRALEYKIKDEKFDILDFEEIIKKNSEKLHPTPNRGIYDHVIYDSEIEKVFAVEADNDTDVVCFLKLPSFYKINTPIGEYNPDFGIVMKKKKIRDDEGLEYYFVIETKGTNNIDDMKALTASEIYKIKCAQKHFEALGIEAKINYCAPVKEYENFKGKIT